MTYNNCSKTFVNNANKPLAILIYCLLRSQEIYSHNIACFCTTAKVENFQVKLWPYVAKVGTAIESCIDVILQKLRKQLLWCIKDSATLRSEVVQIKVPMKVNLSILMQSICILISILTMQMQSCSTGWSHMTLKVPIPHYQRTLFLKLLI